MTSKCFQYYLIDRFAEHPADELEELEVVLLQTGGGRGVEALLARHAEQVQGGVEYALYCLF